MRPHVCSAGGSQLSDTNLTGANLNHADLSKASLVNADLRNATLLEANLRRDLQCRLVGNLSRVHSLGTVWTDGKRCKKGSMGKCGQ